MNIVIDMQKNERKSSDIRATKRTRKKKHNTANDFFSMAYLVNIQL